MERLRELEIIAANAILKAVSDRYAPGTQDRVLKFLADQGNVSIIIQQYNKVDDLELTCLNYWDAMLEPDSLRLEDLVSALLIAFATSFAASLIIEGGKAGFSVLFRRIVKSDSVGRTLAELAKLEQRRREHAQALLGLLNKKATAISFSQAELQHDLSKVRLHVLGGGTIKDFLDIPFQAADLTPIESVVRGVMLTEEQRESTLSIGSAPALETIVRGIALSSYFGAGQIVHAGVDFISSSLPFTSFYTDIEEFRRDILLPIRDTHKHIYLRDFIGRPPKKVIPVQDYDLSRMLEHPQIFMECRPLIGALVLRHGGMTCHTAVLSRGMGIPCIQLHDAEFRKLKDYQFGAIHNGTAILWQSPPSELHQFL